MVARRSFIRWLIGVTGSLARIWIDDVADDENNVMNNRFRSVHRLLLRSIGEEDNNSARSACKTERVDNIV